MWPRPKEESGLDKAAASWVAGMATRKENPKDVLQLMDNGRVKSGAFKDYFWSGDMLVGTTDGLARKMELRHFAGKDFLVIETGGFEEDDIPTDWNAKYTIYMRAK